MDLDWLIALAELEHDEGPHGFVMEDATSAEADPANPDGSFQFVAGVPVVSPEGDVMRAPVFDWAEKARLDSLDRLHKRDPDPLNGVLMPVYKVPKRRRQRRKPTTPQQ